MAFHTKRSPSKAKQILLCPGALALCAALPDYQKNQAGEAARIGTATHALIERCLGEDSEPVSYRGRIIELIENADGEEGVSILKKNAKTPGPGRVFYEVDSDMIDGATLMTDYVRRRLKELKVGREALQLESRTNPLPDRDDTSGTADTTIDAWPAVLEVDDYKNGYNVVEHKGNKQTMAYLLGKALEHDLSHEKYIITIIQPNADHEEGRIRSVTVTKKELLAFQKEYRKGIERSEEAEADEGCPQPGFNRVDPDWAAKHLNAGDDAEHCMFCDAAPVCPARLALAQKDAAVDFEDEPSDFEEPATSLAASRVLEWSDRMETLIRAANGYVQREMENGNGVPGWKLVRKSSKRVWAPAHDAKDPLLAKRIAKEFGVKLEDLFHPAELISGPQAEKLVPSKRREEFNNKYLFKPEGALTIARDTDKREAVNRSAADDFEDDEMDFG